MEVFNRLGLTVEQRWKAKHYDDEDFSDLAFQALQDFAPCDDISHHQIIEWGLLSNSIPEQNNYQFGQPPIILFRSSLFYIEALFWLEGTTSIHQHGFSGAFQVLSGSSIHSTFDFRLSQRINTRFLLGDVKLKTTEYLSRGDTRRILSGPHFIHSLFHLDQPSVTIVVRTGANREFLPQYNYLKPSIALDPFSENQTLKRRLELLTVLQKTKHKDLFPLTAGLLSSSDFESVFVILDYCHRNWDQNQFSSLFELARSQHGSEVEIFTPVFEEIARTSYLVERRKSTENPDHRFFLALLMNLQDQDQILRFIRARYKKDPREQIMQWVKELSRTRLKSETNGNALGIRFDAVSLRMFRFLLEVRSFDAIKNRLKEYYSPHEVESQEKDLRLLYSALLQSIPFKPLFVRR